MYDGATLEVELQYGPQLRASPLKSKRRNAELELHEEQKLLGAFRRGRENKGLEVDWFLIMPTVGQ